FHFPEKLIPLMILNALEGKPLPVYGDGMNVRDWLHVEDHARALVKIVTQGVPGRSYNVGGRSERTNIAVVERICEVLDELAPTHHPHRARITPADDRPGLGRRYAIDATRVEGERGWRPQVDFETGSAATVARYLENRDWWEPLRGVYSGERLGLRK